MDKELRRKLVVSYGFFIAIFIALNLYDHQSFNVIYYDVLMVGLLVFNYFETVISYQFKHSKSYIDFERYQRLTLIIICYILIVTFIFCIISFLKHISDFDGIFKMFLMLIIAFTQYRSLKKMEGEIEY